MNLIELITRQSPPKPWAEGEKIPWNDPGFSERMLREHLSQEHDAASRRSAVIDRHVAWVHQSLLAGEPTKLLDLGCGPGLYTSRLTRLGHECTGIDFSPASITYAKAQAQAERLSCRYIQGDIRAVAYGTGYGLAMLIFGEFNVFDPADVKRYYVRPIKPWARREYSSWKPIPLPPYNRRAGNRPHGIRARAGFFRIDRIYAWTRVSGMTKTAWQRRVITSWMPRAEK